MAAGKRRLLLDTNAVSSLRLLGSCPGAKPEAGIYGRLRAELKRHGKPLAMLDLLIASHALSEGCVLVTADQGFCPWGRTHPGGLVMPSRTIKHQPHNARHRCQAEKGIQDPNDEPASVLLERIRAARQAEAGAGKPSRRGRPKAAANPDQLPLDAAPVPSDPLPPDLLTKLLQECGALSERALLAASELEPEGFFTQQERELRLGSIRQSREEGQVLLEAVS